MSNKTTLTIGDAVSAAFQSILRGDYDERDKMVAMVDRTFQKHGNEILPGDTPLEMGKEGAQ